MAIKIVSAKTEKVLDTNPNIYLQKAEEHLRNGQYNQALEEASRAVKYSNNNQKVKDQYNKIKSTVEDHNNRLNPGKFIKIAEEYLQSARYDEAIEQAQMAVKYSNNDEKYINQLKIIKSIAEVKQSKLRKLEKEADLYMENARRMIAMEQYDEALQQARRGLECINSSKYLNEYNSIESFITRRKAQINADKVIENAKTMLSNGEYDKALTEAENAIKYSSDSKYLNEINKIKTIVENKKAEVENKKAEVESDKLIEKAKLLINSGEYYDALETANYAMILSQSHECHKKYIEEFNSIESSLKKLPKEQLHIIADTYKKNYMLNKTKDNSNYILNKTKEWYKITNDARAYYELGKIELYISYNNTLGKEYLRRSADKNYVSALMELIQVYTQGRRFEKNFKIANKYYKALRKVDKPASKEVLGIIKKKYQLSLIEILKINGWLKIIIIISTVFMILSSGYIGTMFATGKWNGKVRNASIEISSSVLGIGENEEYKIKLNISPFFAKKPMDEVLSEDSSIAKIENGKIQGINEGKTNIVLYLNGDEVKKVPITVSQIGVKDFKIHYDGELKLVGDSITPNIEIIYFNDIENEELNTTYYSSNEDVVRVYKNKLVAIGEGKATVTVKVNDLEKKLIFNIKKEEKPQNSVVESDSKNVNSEFTYETYVNGRYGFSIDHPIDLIANSAPENGDGLLFKNNDGTVYLNVSGINNVSNETATSRYNKDLSKLKVEPVYKSIAENSYAISWKENGIAYYEYYTVGGNNGSIQGFTIRYPDSQNDIYASMVTRIYKSFKPNEIDKVH